MGLGRVVRKMQVQRREGKWWLLNVPPYYVDEEGPFTSYGEYDSKKEAEDDKRGLEVTLKEIFGYPEEEPEVEEETIEEEDYLW